MIESKIISEQISEQIKKIKDTYSFEKKISKFIFLKEFMLKNFKYIMCFYEINNVFLDTIKNYGNDLLKNEKLQNNLLEIIDYLLEINKYKHSITKTPDFLIEIKNILNQENLDIIVIKHNLNYQSKNMKEKTLINYISKKNLINSREQLINSINDLNNFIEINKISIQQVEQQYRNNNNIFLLNFIQGKGIKITEKELINCFKNTWKMIDEESKNYFIFDLFIDIFKETNVFKNGFAPMNKMDRKIRLFFNIDQMKPVRDKENIIDYICNHPNLYKEKLEVKLQRESKIKMFNKLNLSEKEMIIFNNKIQEKEIFIAKKIKI